MIKRYVAITTVLAGFAALFMPSAGAAPTTHHKYAADCRVFPAGSWQRLCRQVQLQHPYGATFDGQSAGAWSEPNGYAIVHEITHQGWTMPEMKGNLKGEADSYKTWVTGVTVNMNHIVEVCGNTDGQWAVQFIDEDGKPGGRKLTWKHIVCA